MLIKYILKNIKYKINICLFLIYLTLFLKWSLNKNKKLFTIHKNRYLSHFKKSILIYPKLNEIKLNYIGKCGEIFKYKKNNERDLVLFCYKSTRRHFERSFLIYNVIDSFKKNIPNAKIVCFVHKDSYNSLVIQLLRKNKAFII